MCMMCVLCCMCMVLVQRLEDSMVYSVLSFSNRVDGSFFYITSSLTWVPDLAQFLQACVASAFTYWSILSRCVCSCWLKGIKY